jgi:hypothetical protein
MRACDDVLSPDITLQAWSARDAGDLKLQQHFRDGSFAEQMMAARRAASEVGFDNRGLGLKP